MDTHVDPETLNELHIKFFEDNKHWVANSAHNDMFIRTQMNWMNDVLQARGYVFINDLYDALGIPNTQFGQLHGWKKGPIEFGITHQVGSGRIWMRVVHEGNILDALLEQPEF